MKNSNIPSMREQMNCIESSGTKRIKIMPLVTAIVLLLVIAAAVFANDKSLEKKYDIEDASSLTSPSSNSVTAADGVSIAGQFGFASNSAAEVTQALTDIDVLREEDILVRIDNQSGETCVARVILVPVRGEYADVSEEYADIIGEPENNLIEMDGLSIRFENGWEDDWFFNGLFFYNRKSLEPGENVTLPISVITQTPSDKKIEAVVDLVPADADILTSIGVKLDNGQVTLLS